MKTSRNIALCLLASVSLAGAAKAGDPGLDSFLAEMAASEKVLDVSQHDIGKDGVPEALVRMAEPCEGTACEWRFVAKTDAGWTVVSKGFAQDAYLEKTAGDEAVLNTDGVTWAWSGSMLYPYASLLEGVTGVAANAEEIAFIAKNSDFTDTEKFDAHLFRIDLFGDGTDDRIFLINGLFYKTGTWGTPYLIFDAADRLLDAGVSMDMPNIYRGSDGKSVHVLEVTPFSTAMKTLR